MDNLASILTVSLEVGWIFIQQQPPKFDNLVSVRCHLHIFSIFSFLTVALLGKMKGKVLFQNLQNLHLVKAVENLIYAKVKCHNKSAEWSQILLEPSTLLCQRQIMGLVAWNQTEFYKGTGTFSGSITIKIWLVYPLIRSDPDPVDRVGVMSCLQKWNKLSGDWWSKHYCQPY